MTRLIDAYAREFDVTGTQVVVVDAAPADVLAALEHLPIASRAIRSLALAERLALTPMLLAGRAHERVYGLIWRLAGGPTAQLQAHEVDGFARPGHVKVIWDIRVEAGAESGAVLSSTMRFVATDESARHNLLDAWGLVGALSTALSRRALASVKRRAEDHDELSSVTVDPSLAA